MKKVNKIILGTLAIAMLAGCDFKEKEECKCDDLVLDSCEKIGTDNKIINSLSLDNEVVKSLVDKFGILTEGTYFYPELKNEEDKNNYEYTVLFNNVDMKIDNSYKKEGNQTIYSGEYVEYEEANKVFNSLFGKDLKKESVHPYIAAGYEYDSAKNIFLYAEYSEGGGGYPLRIAVVDKAETTGAYINIYVKTAYVSTQGMGEGIFLTDPYLMFPSTLKKIYEYPKYDENTKYGQGEENNEVAFIKKYYSDKFDVYKWTFKKNSEGNYILESIELNK